MRCPYCEKEAAPGDKKCTKCGTDLAEGGALAQPPAVTLVERSSEFAKSQRNVRTPTKKETEREADDGTQLFRPLRRPPMAVLMVLADGATDFGELVWIRGDEFSIGRSEGDLQVPHDGGMSSRHAVLSRRFEAGRYRWYIADAGSTNGVFVRVKASPLKHEQEVMLGHRVFKLDCTTQAETSHHAPPAERQVTQRLGDVSAGDFAAQRPQWCEIKQHGGGKRHALDAADNVIGRSAADCGVVLEDDPTVSPRHARLHEDDRKNWHIEDLKSLNGVWLRVDEAPLEAGDEFQLGEQRFRLSYQ